MDDVLCNNCIHLVFCTVSPWHFAEKIPLPNFSLYWRQSLGPNPVLQTSCAILAGPLPVCASHVDLTIKCRTNEFSLVFLFCAHLVLTIVFVLMFLIFEVIIVVLIF